jgi:hypothetical protein
MSNHKARTWDHRGNKPFDPKLLSLDHHLDGYIFRQHLQLLMMVKNNLLWCFLIRHGLTSLESTCCIIYFGLVLVDFCFFSSPPLSSRLLPKFHVHVPLLCVEFLYFSPSSNEGNFPSIENKHGWDSTSASTMTLHHLLSYLTACPIGVIVFGNVFGSVAIISSVIYY